ncbi:MAG: hypothetical protein A2W25_04305 [candidate division Zixibacteria bacterium RBG_16_53_22]|nr:MAG: hypothetical protein A2W25_04305 [candidate division Zixibacteria bacterium RBG_16_53_22]
MSDVVEYLKAVCLMRERMGKPDGWVYGCPEEFVLKNGRQWTPAPLPPDIPRMTVKECFRNAAMLALEHPELTYVEGYALSIISTHHAWCVDKEGRVVDPTWPEVGTEYYGVPFDKAWLFRELHKMEYYGLIDDYRRNFPLLRKNNKGFLSKVKA